MLFSPVQNIKKVVYKEIGKPTTPTILTYVQYFNIICNGSKGPGFAKLKEIKLPAADVMLIKVLTEYLTEIQNSLIKSFLKVLCGHTSFLVKWQVPLWVESTPEQLSFC